MPRTLPRFFKGLQHVTVKVQKVVHFHKFDPAAQPPLSVEYLL